MGSDVMHRGVRKLLLMESTLGLNEFDEGSIKIYTCGVSKWVVISCRWARRLLLLEFAFYMLWLLSFQVFMLLFQVRPRLSHCPSLFGGCLGCMLGGGGGDGGLF